MNPCCPPAHQADIFVVGYWLARIPVRATDPLTLGRALRAWLKKNREPVDARYTIRECRW